MTAVAGARAECSRVLLATLGLARLDRLATTLAEHGTDVTVLTQGASSRAVAPAMAGRPAAVRVYPWDAATRETTCRSVETALEESGSLAQLVVQALPAAAVVGNTVVEHSEDEWLAACGTAALQVVHLLQALAPALKQHGASVVFVGASLGLVGAERLAGLATLLESQRGLMKSLARQWGRHGVTCNWIAMEARELWPGFGDFKLPIRLEAVPVALGRRPDAAADVAGILAFLASPAGRSLTGATLCLDGGEWMVP